MTKILIFDDEKSIREMIKFSLELKKMVCFEASTASSAITQIYDLKPDLLILDWMMPDVSGLEFLRRLRRDPKTKELPVIFLTAKVEEHDIVSGLNAGANDYIKKPFSSKELIARINSVLRGKNSSNGLIEIKFLKLDLNSHKVFVHNQQIDIGPTEFKLLRHFMENQERAFTREQLLDNVWGTNVYLEERTVDVHIKRLRNSLSSIKNTKNCLQPVDYIQTIRGVGYRFSSD